MLTRNPGSGLDNRLAGTLQNPNGGEAQPSERTPTSAPRAQLAAWRWGSEKGSSEPLKFQKTLETVFSVKVCADHS